MTSHVTDPEICWRTGLVTWSTWQLTAFEAVRRCQMDVSDVKSLCSCTRVKDNYPYSFTCFLTEAELPEEVIKSFWVESTCTGEIYIMGFFDLRRGGAEVVSRWSATLTGQFLLVRNPWAVVFLYANQAECIWTTNTCIILTRVSLCFYSRAP